MSVVLSILAIAVFLFLVVYVTWLLGARMRAGDSASKSFVRWLRDLFDLSQGI
jgi:hypothetical protein